jgi:hypothetical protein
MKRGRPRRISRQRFIDALRETRNLAKAAEACEMSRQSAYNLAMELGIRIEPTVILPESEISDTEQST